MRGEPPVGTTVPPSALLVRNETAVLCVIVAGAFLLRVFTALAYPNIHHPDEIFQYWEQGFRLVHGYGVEPWEARLGFRSWLLPGLIGGVFRLTDALGGSIDTARFILVCLFSALSLGIVVASWAWARALAGPAAGLLAAIVAATWFEHVLLSPKALTEALAAGALLPAAYLLTGPGAPGLRRLVLGGALLGLAFALRVQLAPAIAVVALGSLVRGDLDARRGAVPIAVAGAVALASGLLDWATLGTPFQSIWITVQENIVKGRQVVIGGEMHPLWYVQVLLYRWDVLVLPLVLLWALGARRAPILLLIAAAVFLPHSAIAHKEMRYVYPMVPFLMLLAAIGAAELVGALAARLRERWRARAFALAAAVWVAASASLALSEANRGLFTQGADALAAFRRIGEMPESCGVGLVGVHWSGTAGYVTLRRDIPIYHVWSRAELAALAPAFNIALRQRSAPPELALPAAFDQGLCLESGLCIHAREGSCEPQPEHELNRWLERMGH